ncbi:hypothetical protein TNCV_3371971 [Trichonephila clavipes]|nr:hypothetical protein TNCV_3371971 [Trichonephila clavipes]
MELAGAKMIVRCILGCGTRIWIRISEIPLIFLGIPIMKSNRFAFEFRDPIFFPIAFRKFNRQNMALAIASSGIAVTLLNGGQMSIQHSNCHYTFMRILT